MRPTTNNFLHLALLTATIGLASCSPDRKSAENVPAEPEPIAVVASNSILCDLTSQIAQETISLTCLIGSNQDPHTYSPTPSDRKALETAELVLYGGYELEPAIDNLVEKTQTPAPKVAVYELAVPQPILAEHHHHEDREEENHHDHDHHEDEEEENHSDREGKEPDPHVWHNAQHGAAIAESIRNQLAKVNPEQADTYSENAKKLIEKISALDAWIKTQVATVPNSQRLLVTTHDSFNYYIQAYDFKESEALQGLTTEEAPTAAQVKSLVEKVRATGVPTIFAEATANDSAIATVAREANATLAEQELLTDSLGEKGSEAETYIGMLATNTCTIVEGLGGQCKPFDFSQD